MFTARTVGSVFAAGVLVLASTGCYHYNFEQRPAASAGKVITFKERRPTYLNGFIGTGSVNTGKYCAEPVRTELRVTGVDVLLSLATLLIYTPHTLYVTCSVPEARAAVAAPAHARPSAN